MLQTRTGQSRFPISVLATQTPQPLTFCVVCDAVDGDCGHQAARYLQDIVYEPGPYGGWKVPESERARWDVGPIRIADKPKPSEKERDIEDLILEIADVFYLEPPLEQELREAHKDSPLKVSRLVAATLTGATDGSLHTPAGFLRKRLASMPGGTKAP